MYHPCSNTCRCLEAVALCVVLVCTQLGLLRYYYSISVGLKKFLQKPEGAAAITPSLGCLGNTVSGKAAGGNLPLTELDGKPCFPMFVTGNISCTKNPVVAEYCKEGVGSDASYSVGLFQASLLSSCNFFTTELQFTTVTGPVGSAERPQIGWKRPQESKSRVLRMYLSYCSISRQLGIMQAKEIFEIKWKNGS